MNVCGKCGHRWWGEPVCLNCDTPLAVIVADPDRHFQQVKDQIVETYQRGMEERGLVPGPLSAELWAEREVAATFDTYNRRAEEASRSTHEQRVREIIRDHRRRDLTIRREGACMAMWSCPPIALMLLLLAWWGIASGNVAMGLVYALAAVVFLVMLAAVVWQVRKAERGL